MTTSRMYCQEDHTNPELTYAGNGIGSPWTGYGAFTLFVSEGGYGEDQATLDAITALNEEYQGDYDELQAEADGIYEWFNTTHTIGSDPNDEFETMAACETARDSKVARRHEIDAEIDAAWSDLADTIRAMISDAHYEDFLAA